MFKAREPQRVNCKELKDEEKDIISTCSRPAMTLAEKKKKKRFSSDKGSFTVGFVKY